MFHTPTGSSNPPNDFTLNYRGNAINHNEAYHRAAAALRGRHMHVLVLSPNKFTEAWSLHKPQEDKTGFMNLILALVKSTQYKTHAFARIILTLDSRLMMTPYKIEVVIYSGEVIAIHEVESD